ncbi:hypothetical protein JCM10450v2_008127 [Rhodotorula kratochvilovae]
MAAVAGGALAAEVHKAGAFGFIGGGHSPLENLEAEVAKARKALELRDDQDLPLGIGLILWRLETPHLTPSHASTEPDRWLRYIIHTARASAVWLSFSASGDLRGWVERARRVEAEQQRGEKLRVVVMVQTAQAAKEALKWEGLDAVVVQGTEAGGHGPSYAHGEPLSALVSSLGAHLPSTAPPFLLGAGGLASASSIARILADGLAGVVPGTALSVAEESLLPLAQKELLVRAEGESATDRGMKWDEARGTMGWPAGMDGRAIRNKTSEEADAGGEEGRAKYARAMKEGDVERVVTWAGTGVGEVKRIAPAREIVRELMSGVA